MTKHDERIALIQQSIISQAQAECGEWREKAEQYRAQQMDRFEEGLLEEMYAKIRVEVEAQNRAASLELACRARELRESLLRRREQIRGAVFAEVRVELLAWAETEEYRQSLLDGVRALADAHDHHHSTLLLREQDLALADRFRELLGEEATVQAHPAIRIGGYVLENKPARLRVDETLDTRLRDAVSWFLEHSGLSII